MHIAAEEGHLSVIEVLFDFDAKADAETIVGIIQSIGKFSLNIYIFVLEEKMMGLLDKSQKSSASKTIHYSMTCKLKHLS